MKQELHDALNRASPEAIRGALAYLLGWHKKVCERHGEDGSDVEDYLIMELTT